MKGTAALTPPEAATCLTPDGAVKKFVGVTLESSGDVGNGKEAHDKDTAETPLQGSKCFVHYTLCLAESGEEVFNTASTSGQEDGDEDAPPVEIVLSTLQDSPAGMRGLLLGISTMRKFEQCTLYCSSEYGYGDKGNFSFPHVPPDSHLVYHVRLLGWIKPGVETNRESMFFEERLEAAQRRRKWGKEAFDASNYSDAFTFFNMGLSYLDDDMMFQLEDVHLKQAQKVRHPLMLNACLSLLRLEKYEKGVQLAKRVTETDADDGKAWYLLAKCYRCQGNLSDARNAITKALQKQPSSHEVKKESENIRRENEKNKQQQKDLYSGIFNKSEASTDSSIQRRGHSPGKDQVQDQDHQESNKRVLDWLWHIFVPKSQNK